MNHSLRFGLVILLSGLGIYIAYGQAQTQNNSQYQLHIQPTQSNLKIDGLLDEPIWQEAEIAADFWVQAPIDGERAKSRTEVKMTYNDRFIYVAAKCYDEPDYVIQTLKRDNFGESDEFVVLLDPVGQQTNGYAFAASALGAQSEALLSPSSAGLDGSNLDESWDNKWYVAVNQTPEFWTVEFAIPFKTLRYKTNIQHWNINFVRTEPGKNETHVWAPVPRQFNPFDLGYFGQLNWDQAPQKVGGNIALNPYTTASITENNQVDEPTHTEIDAGGEAKIALSPTLNLDLTYNPDFSQVEVDVQVTNLTRFNIFFPERRQFFLENADIFSEFGQFADRPFYSRRIGLDEAGRTVTILYGARLSGNINNKLRVGAFNMHSQSNTNQLGQNYSTLTFQQRFWKRSSIKGIFLNRQAFDGSEMQTGDYGRNWGGELNLSTPDGKWQANGGYMHSAKPGFTNKNQHIYGRFDYNGQLFRTFLAIQHLGDQYFADMGFTGRLLNFNPETNEVVRVGYTQISNMLNYYIYPKASEKVNFHWSGLENFVYYYADGSLNEWYTRLRHFIFFKNTSQLRFRLNNNFVDLRFPFALTATPLPAESYNMLEFNIQFNTDLRKRINTEMFIVYGQFYGGTKLTYRGELAFRTQPWGNFALGLERNDIWLPSPYGNLSLTLATTRAEFNFATNLFWTTFLQYNTQANNFNINSRFQWRFAPMSDLFLVYTDNYRVEGIFGPKDRSLVLKFNYWITL